MTMMSDKNACRVGVVTMITRKGNPKCGQVVWYRRYHSFCYHSCCLWNSLEQIFMRVVFSKIFQSIKYFKITRTRRIRALMNPKGTSHTRTSQWRGHANICLSLLLTRLISRSTSGNGQRMEFSLEFKETMRKELEKRSPKYVSTVQFWIWSNRREMLANPLEKQLISLHSALWSDIFVTCCIF